MHVIIRSYLAEPIGLGGRVDTDEDEVCLSDGLLDVGGEEQVLPTAFLNDLIKPRFKDRQIVRIPLLNFKIKIGCSEIIDM